MSVALVFPNQLFENTDWLSDADEVWLLEEPLFYSDAKYPVEFCFSKLVLLRAASKFYESYLSDAGHKIKYLDTRQDMLDHVFSELKNRSVIAMDPVDFEITKRLDEYSSKYDCELTVVDSALFINSKDENDGYREPKNRWFMADFYKHQRHRLDILISDGEPVGDQYSFDEQNRKKIPKKELPNIPDVELCEANEFVKDAMEYVKSNFPGAPGEQDEFVFPVTHSDAQQWLERFLTERFELFGPYEDALVPQQPWLYHSMLTPMLNIGLLTPKQVVDKALEFADSGDVPLNSLEGFVRQIIGWREFMRATYVDIGVEMRTPNHWNHTNELPASFYDGTTGIDPLDDVITRVLKYGYCHHIERLMVLGGFMFLCEIHPKQIYKWFMELFVDAYDWVMVPNVYSMSQNSDGGLITTKPYFSGSAYLKKMGYPAGDWCAIWDGLYWRWIHNNQEELAKNHRWSMMCAQVRKMDETKLDNHLKVSEEFLSKIHTK